MSELLKLADRIAKTEQRRLFGSGMVRSVSLSDDEAEKVIEALRRATPDVAQGAMHPVDLERADAVNGGLNEQAFRNAWQAFQNTPIDLLADSDDETCKCLSNAIRVFIRTVWKHRIDIHASLDEEEKYLHSLIPDTGCITSGDVEGAFHRLREALQKSAPERESPVRETSPERSPSSAAAVPGADTAATLPEGNAAQDAGSGWRPIETAPIPRVDEVPSYWEFRCLLVNARGHVVEGYAQYTYHKKKLVWKQARAGHSFEPTHWMPLPTAPGAHTEGDRLGAAKQPAIDSKKIAAIDDFLADGQRDNGYRAFAMMRHIWPQLKELALASSQPDEAAK